VAASRSIVAEVGETVIPAQLQPEPDLFINTEEGSTDEPEDVFETYAQAAIHTVAQNQGLLRKIREGGETWVNVRNTLAVALPDVIDNRNDEAQRIVTRCLNEIFGENKWKIDRRPKKSGSGTTAWIVLR
jgi:hypothetical protein